MDDILVRKVTISDSFRKIHFPKILEQALVGSGYTSELLEINTSITPLVFKKISYTCRCEISIDVKYMNFNIITLVVCGNWKYYCWCLFILCFSVVC